MEFVGKKLLEGTRAGVLGLLVFIILAETVALVWPITILDDFTKISNDLIK